MFTGGLSASQQAVFSGAESFWESMILDYAYDNPNVDGLTIEASGTPIDYPGGILGQAGWTDGWYGGTYGSADWAYATAGIMQFDTYDLDVMEANGTLFDVVVHEMAHVLGFGTLWNFTGDYVNGSGQYTGASALAAYQSECDASATFVPVELNGGAGTADAHWSESWACGSDALMTGWLGYQTHVTYTTVASFADLGYIVADHLPSVPLPGGLPMLLGGVAGLGILRRRNTRAQAGLRKSAA
ncbi:VPLPA-CTERM sorting domain-containing protein [Celeribacter neptunius]|uniref:VPLPA-CTERM protein sorting domain-containing protein n=1 Tax=Celeribacter neptunius TaxID=588602 RepID=A0A1I3PC61_9RHOB|nr:VPLPA-CTERM sorting domain-containing protein [Celeribacter neptunius]SFJ18626.1 VPLPA-CTERM protein sorting domain-containing protein [Celeribacter neptunius]